MEEGAEIHDCKGKPWMSLLSRLYELLSISVFSRSSTSVLSKVSVMNRSFFR